MRASLQIADVVDGNNADFILPPGFVKGPQDVAPNASITVDSYTNAHAVTP